MRRRRATQSISWADKRLGIWWIIPHPLPGSYSLLPKDPVGGASANYRSQPHPPPRSCGCRADAPVWTA